VSQEECAILREGVPYVKLYRKNPKHLYTKLNGYGDNGGAGGDMWSEQKHENLSLIRAFVINHQGNLNLTTGDNLIAVNVYVAYRKPFPDKGTVKRVKREGVA
jgi:hypothetical protein